MKKMKYAKKTGIILLLVIALIMVIVLRRDHGEQVTLQALNEFQEQTYQDYLDENGYDGIMSEDQVVVNVQEYTISEDMEAEVVQSGVLTSDQGKITWFFDVEKAGFYNIEVSYLPVQGTNSQIKRIISVDESIPYDGLKQIVFNRSFADKEIEVKNGNELRPESMEVFVEKSVYLDDSQKRILEPYKFYFSSGKHSISFESVKEPVIITGIVLKTKEQIPSYQEVMGNADNVVLYDGENLIYQVERIDGNTVEIVRSSSSININNNVSDPAIEPYHPYKIVYNTIGGNSWKYSGETIEWTIEVPEDGYYRVAFKGRQSVSRGITSYRRLTINGEVPFAEAEKLPFEYSTDMRQYVLGEGTTEGAYIFHFNKGKNTISLEAVLGDFGGAYTQINEGVAVLNELYRSIIQITGTVPDRYVDYEIVDKLPNYIPTIQAERERLTSVLNEVVMITGEKGENANLIERIIVQLDRLLLNPDDIALSGELSTFKSNITSLATWLINIAEMPLELDYIALYGANSAPKEAKAGFWSKLYNDTIRFFATFFIDDTQVDTDDRDTKKGVTVWIPSGRDQAQLLRRLIDESFTPQTGIEINLELVPIEVVLPSTLAGTGPDVVLSIDQTTMMDFAMRNSLVDLSSLDGYEELRKLYFNSAIEGVTYQDQVFGLPETQTFYMLFYRQDILNTLGIEPPKTWKEFKEVIPVLQMNNYDAYLPESAIYSTMLVQNGGDLYMGEGKDYGIQSGLSEDIAMDTFKELTDFFTAYKLPVTVDFANRFRTGEVPIGIANYTEYNRFELLAPEIKGLWAFEPIPGVEQEDGTIDNTAVSTTTQCIMLTTAVERDVEEEAWTFMKWWMSTDVQTDYANAIEAMLGTSARYATANKEVLVQLPWATADANKLLDQFENTKGIPPVPGNYMTTRMLEYAFKDVVSDELNPRETLYLNIKDINDELTKKRREFGIGTVE